VYHLQGRVGEQGRARAGKGGQGWARVGKGGQGVSSCTELGKQHMAGGNETKAIERMAVLIRGSVACMHVLPT
jgi:hypothetical protein